MIRVFPRKTKWTPIDELSFVGDPPLWRPEVQPLNISCAFTWDIEEAERLKRSWSRFYPEIYIGGPAYDDNGSDFVPGRFVKEGITITSRGCTKSCEWCLVPKREGWIRELSIHDGWDIADNNLLACSKDHIKTVFEMLRRQQKPIKFSGGFDTEILQPWHVDLLKSIRLKYVWFGCDYPGAIIHLRKAAEILSDFSINKKRCYVLIGYKGESIKAAEKRIMEVYQLGFLPYAMLYRDHNTLNKLAWPREWLELQRYGCRPASYRVYNFKRYKEIRKI